MLYATLVTRLPVEIRRQVESSLEPADAVAMLRVSKKLNALTKESPTLLKAMLDEQGDASCSGGWPSSCKACTCSRVDC